MILGGCYFTGLAWFWLIYAKVSKCYKIILFKKSPKSNFHS
ncbi:hypothetical protein [uncultured Gammaproteobacteria bacterium]|nr:hypothetical protein [uncultured Gammaproteobacteria bacterium]CAC9564674.1 hypothetical protein [uncultured Gammaproteobacteria bacterium]CAC9572505.1 hypothetical protein [uncultured Gammaproteobacteria bacterium]CAC9572840.1 hypothetical protein [uncultured Gammaproteobacteria bacterium]CAC9574112.1 hypothetical protein [uncultured Gammaproteobacteria bacterium]